MKHALVALGAVAALAALGCEPAHVASYTPKSRKIDVAPPAPSEGGPPSHGSLYKDGALGAGLFVDARAFRVSDVVLVNVEEVADAERSADTDVGRNSRIAAGLAAVPIIGAFVPADATVDATASATSDSEFRGGGSTNRRERLVATVSTVVKQVLPNGNLFVEGHRAILVNNEEHHLYVSGIVRPIDVDENNAVPSSKIAEAEIEFVGRGVVSDNGNQGVIARFLGWIWPF